MNSYTVNITLTLSKCFWKRWAVSILCLRWSSIITLRVSLAWCGRNSLRRWWIWMNKRLRSSTFSARRGESGHWTSKSSKSRKLTSKEWFNFRSSRRRSKCWGYNRLMPWNQMHNYRIWHSHSHNLYISKILLNVWRLHWRTVLRSSKYIYKIVS